MSDIHITREMLRGVAHGDLALRFLLDVGYHHLSTLCPTCRAEILAWSQEQALGHSEPKPLVSVLPPLLERHAGDAAAERVVAERDLLELLRLPHPDRLPRIRRARGRFRGVTLAALLLEASREKMPADFQAVHELAETALTVLRHTPAGLTNGELMVRAVSYMGNAKRAMSRLQEARSRFEFARSLVRFEGVTESLALAELDWFEGALAMDQRRFRSAEQMLGRAVVLSLLAAGPLQAARPMLTLGTMYYNRGEYRKAIEVTQLAVGLLPGDQDELFYLSCRHNLALYLCEAGRCHEAADALEQDEPLYARFPEPFTQLRLLWVRGKIAAGLGQRDAAERAFNEARDGFLSQGVGYDAAMVSLDLALLFAQQRRTGDLLRVAEEMHPIFEAQDVHREAAAAILLFQKAARKQAVTCRRARRARPLSALRPERSGLSLCPTIMNPGSPQQPGGQARWKSPATTWSLLSPLPGLAKNLGLC